MSTIVFTDGSASGQKGTAGIGISLVNSRGQEFHSYSGHLPSATNNQAEYQAAIHALEICRDLGLDDITVCTDSELLVRQINGEAVVRSGNLHSVYERLRHLRGRFASIKFIHISRRLNGRADELADRGRKRAPSNPVWDGKHPIDVTHG